MININLNRKNNNNDNQLNEVNRLINANIELSDLVRNTKSDIKYLCKYINNKDSVGEEYVKVIMSKYMK